MWILRRRARSSKMSLRCAVLVEYLTIAPTWSLPAPTYRPRVADRLSCSGYAVRQSMMCQSSLAAHRISLDLYWPSFTVCIVWLLLCFG